MNNEKTIVKKYLYIPFGNGDRTIRYVIVIDEKRKLIIDESGNVRIESPYNRLNKERLIPKDEMEINIPISHWETVYTFANTFEQFNQTLRLQGRKIISEFVDVYQIKKVKL